MLKAGRVGAAFRNEFKSDSGPAFHLRQPLTRPPPPTGPGPPVSLSGRWAITDDPQLHHVPLGLDCIHLRVNMQRMFAEDTDLRQPWMARALLKAAMPCAAPPEHTILARSIPAE